MYRGCCARVIYNNLVHLLAPYGEYTFIGLSQIPVTSMALFKVLVLALAAAHAHAATIPTAARDCPDDAWGKTKFESLVVFGDSYSDDSRLSYFIAHNGTAPPVGWVDPAVRFLTIITIHDDQADPLG